MFRTSDQTSFSRSRIGFTLKWIKNKIVWTIYVHHKDKTHIEYNQIWHVKVKATIIKLLVHSQVTSHPVFFTHLQQSAVHLNSAFMSPLNVTRTAVLPSKHAVLLYPSLYFNGFTTFFSSLCPEHRNCSSIRFMGCFLVPRICLFQNAWVQVWGFLTFSQYWFMMAETENLKVILWL